MWIPRLKCSLTFDIEYYYCAAQRVTTQTSIELLLSENNMVVIAVTISSFEVSDADLRRSSHSLVPTNFLVAVMHGGGLTRMLVLDLLGDTLTKLFVDLAEHFCKRGNGHVSISSLHT